MIGTKVALGTCLRLTSLPRRKSVSGMTGRAASPGTVGVQPADTGIGPAFVRQLVGGVFIDLHLAAMAAFAAGNCRLLAAGHMGQVGIF